MSWRRSYIMVAAALTLGLAACTSEGDAPEDPADVVDDDGDSAASADSGEGVLDQVRDRGTVVCGVNDAVPGFGVTTADGDFEGFDVDFCRAIAAAALGDAEAVDYVPLTAEARFTALQSGEIDVLVRNTTWTATRDGGEGASFAMTTFYDGQGVMVRSDAGFGSVDEMGDTVICVLSGTTTELNLESQFSARGLAYEALTFEDNDTLREAFLSDRCDGWTSDKSQLAAVRSAWPEDEGGPAALTILDDTLSKEPLGPAVRDGDTAWFDVVNWAVIATIQAEEFGVTSSNVESLAGSTDPETEPELARFLGIGGFDAGLGLDPEFAVDVVSQVGNYGEIFDRNIGPDTGLGLERGENALWTDGGQLYPPPYR
ncbi:MAG: amino acid ABC transporter substrate-binding protein [Nitriliruptoraceae bacterium]